MNIVAALLGEHGPLLHQVAAFRQAAAGWSPNELRAAAQVLAEAIGSHATVEDELLFEPLATSGKLPSGPVEAMRAEHEQIEDLLAFLSSPPEEGGPDRQRAVQRLAETLRHHFAHEEHALFPMAVRFLDAARLEELGAAWAERRNVVVAALPSTPLVPSP